MLLFTCVIVSPLMVCINLFPALQQCVTEKQPVWFVFAGMGTQWHGMGRAMMELDVFRNSIQKSELVLKPFGINLVELIMEGEEPAFDDTVNAFIGIAAIQVHVDIKI